MKTFKALWQAKTHKQKSQLAVQLETSINYLAQVAHGHRRPGKHFVRAMEEATGIPRHILFTHYYRKTEK